MSTKAACQESRDALACPPADALALARIAAHRSRCPGCRTYAARLGQLGSAVHAAAPGLDDLARARMAARLALSLDELATQHARRHAAAVRPSFYRLAGALLVAVGAVILAVRWHSAREIAMPFGSGTRPAGPTAIAQTAVPPLLHPYAVTGMPAAAILGHRTDHLELPSGAVVHASLGEYAQITLIGPARLAVVAAGALTAVRLDSGVLIGQYEHHAGGILRIESPAATTIVVGTVFAVEARDGVRSRVAVSRGAVVVHSGAERIHLGAGWSWSSGAAAQPVIPAGLAQQLAAQAAAPLGAATPVLAAAHPVTGGLAAAARPAGATPVPAKAAAAKSISPLTLEHDAVSTLEPTWTPAAVSASKPTVPAAVPTPAPAPVPAAVSTAEPTRVPAAAPTSAPARIPAAPPTSEPAWAPSAAPTSAPARVSAASPSGLADAEPLGTPDALYAQAEAAMRAGNHAAVRDYLGQVIRRFPTDGLADAALLELARLAQKEGQPALARSYLDTLLARPREVALWEPARYLRCRLEVDANRSAPAATCLAAFRHDFPDSPHDAEVLALLIGLAQAQGDCPRARPLLDEYLKRYPAGPLDARRRRDRCAR